MKKFFILILVLFSTLSCAQNTPAEDSPAFNPENVLIDVRSPQEFEAGHIKNAVNIPLEKLTADIKNNVTDKEKTIVLYCRTGRRSAIAENLLKEMGYKSVINAGTHEDLKALEDKGN
ncbi:MAG: rhodanese-like domain-containing protein [Deltaproteobacteria bacterium]|nr:rhodanese-like domain-containing protein [Deltaproteobacteria bacterium]